MSSPIIPKKINQDDLTRLTELQPRAPAEEIRWAQQYLEDLRDSLGSITVSKETLEKLKASLHKVQATGKDADSQFGKTIASLANRILHTLAQHEAIAMVAATSAKPLAAKAWLQARLGKEPQRVLKVVDHIQRVKGELLRDGYSLQDHIQAISAHLHARREAKAPKEEIAAISQKFNRVQETAKGAIKEMDAVDKELDILKKDYPFPETKPVKQTIKDRVKKLRVRVDQEPSLKEGDMKDLIERLKALELSTSDLDPRDAIDVCNRIDKRLQPPRDLESVLSSTERLTSKLQALREELPFTQPLQPSGLGTHPVYLLERAALKQESAAHELFLVDLCAHLGIPDAIIPTGAATVEAKRKSTGESLARVTGVIQPLVERATDCNILRQENPLVRSLVQRFDTADCQRKIFIQILLAAWDLHAANGSLVPKVTPEYLSYEEKSWEYEATDGTWKKLPQFVNLVSLSLEGIVTERTKVRNDGKENTTRRIGDDAELQKALNTKWQLAFFDNARTLGNESAPTRANPNHLRLYQGVVVLPTRLFPLGLPISNQPLEPEVKAYILSLQQKREDLEKVLFEGSWTLWQHFSKENARELRELLKSDAFAYSASMQCGGSKAELVDKIPPALLNRLMQDLERHKVKVYSGSAEKINAEKDRFAMRLFPHLDRVQGVAFLERMDQAIAYLRTCEQNCKEFDAIVQIPTDRFGALEFQAYHTLLSKAFDAIQKSPIPIITKEELKERSTATLTELIRCKDQGSLDKKTFNDLTKLLHDFRRYLEPSLSGLHGAMFPYFEPFFDLLTMSQEVRTCFEDPSHVAFIKTRMGEREQQLAAMAAPPAGEKEAIFVCKELLDTIQQFMTSTIRMSRYRNFPYAQWGEAQAGELKAILQNCLIFTSKSKISVRRRNQWDTYLKQHIDIVHSALLKCPFTKEEHKELMQMLSRAVKQIYDEVESDNLAFLNSQEALFALMLSGSFQDVRSALLLEKRTGFLGKGGGYSFEDCAAILQVANHLHRFPQGKKDPKYKELLAIIKQTQAR